MSQTLAQKIIANAAGCGSVTAGEIVIANVDLAMMHDSGGPRRVKPVLERLGRNVWDPEKIVVITDHYLPAHDEASRAIQTLTRQWVNSEGVSAFHDGEGICHTVLAENGYVRPGMFVVGGDSHSPTGGAFGAYMFGIGATEMAGVLATGEIWIKVPETIRIEWAGALGAQVFAKDMMLHTCGQLGLGGADYQAVEYTGSAVGHLPMQERMTLANMTAEIGGQAGLVPPDQVTADFLKDAGAEPGNINRWHSDPDAPLRDHHTFDAAALAPQVAAPHSPANAGPVDNHKNENIDVAYIGACTGAKLEDLRAAGHVLKGRRLDSGISLIVAPATRRDQDIAAQEGLMQVFEDAGARILANACGICAGYGADRLGEDTVCISSTARNFKGRMGAASSRVFLASPATVAASAIAGHIADPREMVERP